MIKLQKSWKKLTSKLPKLSERQKYWASSIIFLALGAIFLTWFLEYRYFLNDFTRVWSFFFGSPTPFYFNALLMFLLLVFLWGLIGRPGVAFSTMWSLIIVLTYIHINKYNSRGFPLLPEDFQLASQAATLTKFVDVWSIVRMVIAIILIAALTVAFEIALAKKLHLHYQTKSPSWTKRNMIGTRMMIVAMAGLAFFFGTDFVRHNDGSRYEDTFLGTHFTAWNQNRNYDDNGFILGFLYNLQKLRLVEPDKYSESKMEELKAEYDAIAEAENANRINPADEDVSVVVILNESFYDPATSFQGLNFKDYYKYEGDVTPNLHRIMQDYPSGLMYSLDYGGGTANIEFETLTSLTNYWIDSVPYTALLPKTGAVPSIVQSLKAKGYSTTAIHPFNGGMYKRNIALANEGFDTFITELEMDHKEHEGNSEYINDKSAYQQTLDVLKDSKDNQVIGLITMQNHTPYNGDTYEETEFEVDFDLDSEKAQREWEIPTYFQSLHTSDEYLGEFIDELDKLDKKVVVLWFGDHSAGLFDNLNDKGNKEERDLTRVTPYFVYANYDAGFTTKNLPTTTPNCMANTMQNILNWQKSSLYYLVDKVCAAEPILTPNYLQGRELNDIETMRDYELLTYDILSGKQYWLK